MIFGKKKYTVKESFGSLETHEVFLDSLAHQKEDELGLTEKKFEVAISSKILLAIFGIFLLAGAVLFGKTVYLQAFEGKNLAHIAQNNKSRISLIRPERGVMYDRNMQKLVSNSPAYDLVCDKRNFLPTNTNYPREISTMAAILQLNPVELQQQFVNSDEPKIVVAENLKQEPLLILEARMAELPDCAIEQNTTRNYALGEVFSHVLGYTSKITKQELQSFSNYSSSDYTGKVGLEGYYESTLRGTPGQLQIIRNASGIQQSKEVVLQPISGNNLVLNIDAGLQQATYASLEKSIKSIGAKKGAAVALNPQTGAVLAMVSYPAYDNNIFSQGISQADYSRLANDPNQPFFNRVIAAKYPTGSTIKPFLASGALQEGIISPSRIINDPGYLIVRSQNDPSVSYRFGGVTPHGDVDMRKAIAVSSNIYFYTIGGGYGDQKGLGPSGIRKYLDMYGWEQKTGIDIPGEFSGFVPSPDWKKQRKNENWWDGDTYNLSIGQSDLQITPLQVAVAYGAIANGGTLYQPQIVDKIISSSEQEVVDDLAPEVAGKLSIDAKHLQVVREGMRDAVEKPYGGSHLLSTLPFSVAGKTGTAETGKSGYFNTWSSSFAPYDNPEIVFVTTIEGVQGLRSATLPVANEVLYWWWTHR